MFANIAFKILANVGALWAATRYVSGFSIAPQEFLRIGFFNIDPLAQTLIAGGLALAIINAVLYPLLKVTGDLLPFITTAMVVVAVNMVILYLGDIYLAHLAISGLKPLFWSALIIGIVNTLI